MVLVLGLLSLLMVHGRRQEFGRRRALGAGRGALVVATVALAASAQVPSAVLAGLRDPVRVLRTA